MALEKEELGRHALRVVVGLCGEVGPILGMTQTQDVVFGILDNERERDGCGCGCGVHTQLGETERRNRQTKIQFLPLTF